MSIKKSVDYDISISYFGLKSGGEESGFQIYQELGFIADVPFYEKMKYYQLPRFVELPKDERLYSLFILRGKECYIVFFCCYYFMGISSENRICYDGISVAVKCDEYFPNPVYLAESFLQIVKAMIDKERVPSSTIMSVLSGNVSVDMLSFGKNNRDSIYCYYSDLLRDEDIVIRCYEFMLFGVSDAKALFFTRSKALYSSFLDSGYKALSDCFLRESASLYSDYLNNELQELIYFENKVQESFLDSQKLMAIRDQLIRISNDISQVYESVDDICEKIMDSPMLYCDGDNPVNSFKDSLGHLDKIRSDSEGVREKRNIFSRIRFRFTDR